MPYVPQNPDMFTRVYSGALAGMCVSHRNITATDPATYAGYCNVAGAFAKEFDATWALTPTSELELQIGEEASEAIWEDRASSVFGAAITPSTYQGMVSAVIALMQAALAYYVSNGITPPPGSVGVLAVLGALPIVSSGGATPTISINPATHTTAGSLSAADKTKLDGIAPGATNTPLTSTPPVDVTKSAALVGVATDAARADHKHSAVTAAPLDVGVANVEGTGAAIARADHVHNLPFVPVQTALALATGNISVNNVRITNLQDPVDPQDAATKAFALSVGSGLSPKAAVDALADAPIALTGLFTIDGYALSAGERVLVAGQGGSPTVPDIANGIYITAVGAWSRSADMANGSDGGGSAAFVENGTLWAGTQWVCVTMDPTDIVGTNPLQFSQFGASSVLTAGDGLYQSGNAFNVGANADGSITVNADDIQVGVLASDVQHGVRGGGTQHAIATTLVNGFMSAADLVKLNASGILTSSAPVDVTKSAAVVGVSGESARADHKHSIATAAAVTIGTADTEGSASTLARSDHGHDHGAQALGTGNQHAAVTSLVNGFMAFADKVKLDGIASGATNTPLTSSAPLDVTKSAAVVGISTDAARADHKHSIATAAAVTVGTANSEGVSSSLARADHAHDHGAQALGTGNQHAVATESVAGFMSAADKTALDALVTGGSCVLSWGSGKILGTTTTRYLAPWYGDDTAQSTIIEYRVPRAGTIKHLRVRQNGPAGNGNAVVYTLLVNGAPSTLTASMPSTASDGSDLVHSVAVAAGDLVSLRVSKAASTGAGPTNVIASMELAA